MEREMRLTNSEGEELEIMVTGYEFPGPDYEFQPERDELTWLNITINAKHSRGDWTATGSYLNTLELANLIHWFEQIGEGKSVDKDLVGFIEPCLNFEVVSENPPVIQVSLSNEFRPPWVEGVWDCESMSFPMDSDSVAAVVSSLRLQLAEYPERGEETGTPSDQD
jgi:hypothetical protein